MLERLRRLARGNAAAVAYDQGMSDEGDMIPARERARIKSRDRKTRGPKVVVDNPGLKKLALYLATKRRKRKTSS